MAYPSCSPPLQVLVRPTNVEAAQYLPLPEAVTVEEDGWMPPTPSV